MQSFVDRAMSVIAQEYIDTKSRLLVVQQQLAEERARELARSEEALRRQTRVLESVLDSMRDGIIVCDEGGHPIIVNRAAEQMGATPGDAAEAVTFLVPGGAQLPREETPLARAIRGEASDDVELLVKAPKYPEGAVFLADGRPLRDADGTLKGGLVAFRDVTERRRLEEMQARSAQLEAQNRRIHEANRLKSEFLANMSHELRTPLNAIIGFAELMHGGKVGPVSAEHKEYLGDILASGAHLLQLINDVLDLAKVESGKLEFRPQPVDVARLVAEVVGMMRTSAAAKRLRIEVAVDPALGPVVLDPARLKQVLYNFLSNALKFTGEGGHVAVRARREGSDTFRVEVEDDGIGISEADLGRLFVEFQQLDAGASKRHAGTGLGLALTKRLVEAQGGSVGVRSDAGRGSTFHAVLPTGKQEHLPPLPRLSSRSPGERPSVLVIEDNPRDRELLVRTLDGAGYAVEIAATGAEAIRLCHERVFDAITLDLLLPDMNGLDVLAAIRVEGRSRRARVIVVTVVAEKGAVAGFAVDDVLPKPVDGPTLLNALERAGVSKTRSGLVLVVDDDPGSLRLMEAALTQLGYRALCVGDGESALAAIATTPPLAVVLDLLMPRMDGFQFLERLRRSEGHPSVPVIVWTVKDLSGAELLHLHQSAQAVVQKGNGGTAVLVEQLQLLVGRRGATTRTTGAEP